MKRLAFNIIALFFAFHVNAQNFSEIVKAVASDREESDRLGYAVSIDGNFAAIGAYADDFGGSNPNMGSVYIYEMQGLNNWVEVQKLSASDQDDYDRFGWSVDMDGDFLVIGAYGEDDDVNDANPLSKAGSAYIFQNVAGTWTEMQKVVASDREADDEFGWSVAIHDSTIVVGAHIEDHDAAGGNFKYHSGSVYMFELNGSGIWTETQKVVADDRWVDMNYPNGYSGEDLADQFGHTVDIWGDYMIVGALHHDYATTSPLTGGLWSSGAAYIFERSGGIWSQVQKIQNSDRTAWDRFGSAVAIDTNVIIVGVYAEDEDENGNNQLMNSGSAYMFERNPAGVWNETQKIVPNDRNSGDHFGWSVDFRDTLMVIGCHSDDHDEFDSNLLDDAGSAYIFEKNGGLWVELQKIDASDRGEGDDFGIDVGLFGHTVLVGAQYHDFNAVGADSLDDAGAGYFFSNNLCPILTGSSSPIICQGMTYTVGTSTYNTSGIYTDVIQSVDGCDSTVTTDLTVLPEITVDVYASMCDGGTYYIFGTPTTTPGNYSYTLTASNGCDSTIITHLTMDPPITSDNYVSICYGESYTIGTSTYTQTGTYQDVVSATNFCDSTITTHLTVQLPNDASISQNESILTANESGATYQWIDCSNGTSIVGATNQTYNATQIGDYAVVVTKNGCSDTSACIHVSSLIVGLEHLILAENVSVYPNPSNGTFTIANQSNISAFDLRIIDATGQIVFFQNEIGQSIVIEGFAPGLYFAEITQENATCKKQIVIQ